MRNLKTPVLTIVSPALKPSLIARNRHAVHLPGRIVGGSFATLCRSLDPCFFQSRIPNHQTAHRKSPTRDDECFVFFRQNDFYFWQTYPAATCDRDFPVWPEANISRDRVDHGIDRGQFAFEFLSRAPHRVHANFEAGRKFRRALAAATRNRHRPDRARSTATTCWPSLIIDQRSPGECRAGRRTARELLLSS